MKKFSSHFFKFMRNKQNFKANKQSLLFNFSKPKLSKPILMTLFCTYLYLNNEVYLKCIEDEILRRAKLHIENGRFIIELKD